MLGVDALPFEQRLVCRSLDRSAGAFREFKIKIKIMLACALMYWIQWTGFVVFMLSTAEIELLLALFHSSGQVLKEF